MGTSLLGFKTLRLPALDKRGTIPDFDPATSKGNSTKQDKTSVRQYCGFFLYDTLLEFRSRQQRHVLRYKGLLQQGRPLLQ